MPKAGSGPGSRVWWCSGVVSREEKGFRLENRANMQNVYDVLRDVCQNPYGAAVRLF